MPPASTPYGDYYFRGGHRIWHAPEAMPRTYIPDGELQITELPDGVLLESPTEPGTGIRKQIKLQQAPTKAVAVASCDNEYVLYVNRENAQAGENW